MARRARSREKDSHGRIREVSLGALWGQGLVVGALLDVALERFRRCRCFFAGTPDDPYHLADASART